MAQDIKLFALGGLDEVAKCLTVVEIDGNIFVINCGVRYPDKSTPGVDYIIPKFTYLLENRKRIKAYILTHGSDALMAGLTYIYSYCPAPIYCSNVTGLFLESFRVHNNFKDVKFIFHFVDATSEFVIANTRFNFFQIAHNVARCSGLSIHTEYGNIVYMTDYIIEHHAGTSYDTDLLAISKLAEEPTAILMCESIYADKIGYTHPKNSLEPLFAKLLKEKTGRLFIAAETFDMYTIEAIANFGIKQHKKLLPYDESTLESLKNLKTVYDLNVPETSIASLNELSRLDEKDVLIFIDGFGARLFHKIALLANGQNEDKRIKLKPTDTFVLATTFSNETEIVATDCVDSLYRSGAKVIHFKKNEFLKMHASMEDIKTMISLFKPHFYIPIRGTYINMYQNAKLAMSTNIGLKHTNIFLLDNGMVVRLDEYGASISGEMVVTGDLFIDGKGIGGSDNKILEDRSLMASDGVVNFGVVISKSKRKILGEITIESVGFAKVQENPSIFRVISTAIKRTIENELMRPTYSLANIEYQTVDVVTKTIKREMSKRPLIVPFIEEVA